MTFDPIAIPPEKELVRPSTIAPQQTERLRVCGTVGFCAIVLLGNLLGNLGNAPAARAQEPPEPSAQPFDLGAIEAVEDGESGLVGELDCTTDCVLFTDRDISQYALADPSLWWTISQIGERLVPNWIVYPIEARVDFAIDPQRWNWMDYFERYTLVTQLSHVLRPQGYNFRLFDPQSPDRPIASYTCNFDTAPPICQMRLSGSN